MSQHINSHSTPPPHRLGPVGTFRVVSTARRCYGARMSPCSLVTNADDFGLSASVNQAVVRAHTEGILTSTSLLANGPAFDEAVVLAKAHPTLGVGVHLNCLRGQPLTAPDELASWLDGQGRFVDFASVLASRYLYRRLRWEEIAVEWQAQIDRICQAGIHPTHLDSEKHLHLVFPRLTALAIQLAQRNRIPFVRTVREPIVTAEDRAWWRPQVWKRMVLNGRSRGARRRLRAAGLRSTDHFYGIAGTGQMTVTYVTALVHAMVAGVNEMMFHPALAADRAAVGESFLQEERVLEWRTLCAPALRAQCQQRGIHLVHFGALV